MPNGTDNATDAAGISGDWDLLNGDSISFSIDVATGDQTGKCELTLEAKVQTLGGHTIDVSQQSMATETKEPLPRVAPLGTVTGLCTTDSMEVAPPEDPIDVATGQVDVWADLDFPEHCDNEDYSTVAIRYRHEDDDPDDWTNLTSIRRGDKGTAKASRTVDLSKNGTYIFEVKGMFIADQYDADCLLAIILFWGGLSATVVSAASTLLSGGTLGPLFLASLAFALGSAAAIPFACEDEVADRSTYSVLVEAHDGNDNTDTLLSLLGGGQVV